MKLMLNYSEPQSITEVNIWHILKRYRENINYLYIKRFINNEMQASIMPVLGKLRQKNYEFKGGITIILCVCVCEYSEY